MATAKVIAPVSKRPGTKLRVAAYCRVSSNSADQQNSYSRQVDAYTRLVSNNPAWELVDIFADAGISGMKADNREQFQRMIRMCELHQIDMIITKSVSRFARNVKEALEYCRKLKLLGIGVKFEKEGSDAGTALAVTLARKRASMMQPQTEFRPDYFMELIDHVTLGLGGAVRLITKTEAEIGVEDHDGNEDC